MMISRVADHCFWLGRYLERAESTARVLLVTRILALDGELSQRQCWRPVIIVSGEEARFVKSHGEDALADGDKVQDDLTWSDENPSCIQKSIAAARENARSIRETLTLEVWETLNELHLWIASDHGRLDYHVHRYGFYKRVIAGVQLDLGYLASTMLETTPMDFIRLGVALERVSQTARLLDVHHHAFQEMKSGSEVVETSVWLTLLKAFSGFEPFMRRHRGIVTPEAVAAFLILEERFPRSIRHGVRTAAERLRAIRPREEEALPGRAAQDRLEALDAWLATVSKEGLASGLHEVLTRAVDESAAVCEGLSRELLGYREPALQTQAQ